MTSALSRRWRWILGLALMAAAPAAAAPLLWHMFRNLRPESSTPLVIVGLAALALGVAGAVLLPTRRWIRAILILAYLPLSYLTIVAGAAQLFLHEPSRVRLENRSSTALTALSVDFGGRTASFADLAPGKVRVLKGRPIRDGMLQVTFTQGARTVKTPLAYVTPGLPAKCAVWVNDDAVRTDRCL